MWTEKYTLIAGADLSGQQYKFINALGTLAGSETNVFGVNQSKGLSGDHIPAVKFGHSLLYMSAACSKGDFVGQSNTVSGAGSVVTSGIAFAQVLPGYGCNSGEFAHVTCFGVPVPLVL